MSSVLESQLRQALEIIDEKDKLLKQKEKAILQKDKGMSVRQKIEIR